MRVTLAQLILNGETMEAKMRMDLDFFSASLTTEEMCELSLNEGSGVHESTSELFQEKEIVSRPSLEL